jgi:hypothetical protein
LKTIVQAKINASDSANWLIDFDADTNNGKYLFEMREYEKAAIKYESALRIFEENCS